MKNTLNGVKIKIVALGKTGSNVINKMILNNIVKGILDLIKKQGIVNSDFADIKSILQNSGKTVLGFGKADGEDRAKKVVE